MAPRGGRGGEAGEGPGGCPPIQLSRPPHPAPSQSELSDGIAMLVAGNDRIQAIITQMEEICRTIEVGAGGGVPGHRAQPGAVPMVGTRQDRGSP